MSVVVSDTSPLHYLILCGAETALARLFSQVVIPPTVFRELQQPNTPALVREWANSLPAWAAVQAPKSIDLLLDVDAGELEAICLAREIHAAAVLMDDRAGRRAAIGCGLAVIGTIGPLEQAAARGLLELAETIERISGTMGAGSPRAQQPRRPPGLRQESAGDLPAIGRIRESDRSGANSAYPFSGYVFTPMTRISVGLMRGAMPLRRLLGGNWELNWMAV